MNFFILTAVLSALALITCFSFFTFVKRRKEFKPISLTHMIIMVLACALPVTNALMILWCLIYFFLYGLLNIDND